MKVIFILSIILGFSSIIVPISADEEMIPNWVRQNALWWGEEKISDSEFISSMEYLIKNKFIKINDSDDPDQRFMDKYKDWAKKEIKKYKDYSEQLKSEKEILNDYKQTALKKIRELSDENRRLVKENQMDIAQINQERDYLEKSLGSYAESLEKWEKYADEVDDWYDEQQSKPETKIYDQTIHWKVTDSKGNTYNWNIPVESYESYVIADRFDDQFLFEGTDGRTFSVIDHTKYVKSSFSNVVDKIYENSENDKDFLYEIWFITSQLTTYSYDIGEYPRYALETLSRGGGDCEDTTILILDLIKSSEYSTDWELEMLYFDTENLENPNGINHVVPVITIGEQTWIIESTAKTDEGMNSWNSEQIFGWWKEV